MSDEDWENEDWENEDVEARLKAVEKEKERARRRAEGLDSESEEEAAPTPKAAAAPAPAAPKPAKAKAKSKSGPADDPSNQAALLDPKAEKLRQQKLIEERDERLAGDLFADRSETLLQKEAREKAEKEEKAKQASKPKVVVVDAFDQVELTKTADIDKLSEDCTRKLTNATCKNACSKFLSDTFKLLENGLDLKELTELEKALADIVKEKKATKGQTVDAKASKANVKCTKTTKFNANSAWEEVYGGGDGDEEWTQEEWDEWYAQQEAAKAKK